jgi:hypothetical protein
VLRKGLALAFIGAGAPGMKPAFRSAPHSDHLKPRIMHTRRPPLVAARSYSKLMIFRLYGFEGITALSDPIYS